MSQRRSLVLSPEMASDITFTTPFPVFTASRAEALRAVLRSAASGEGWQPMSKSAAFSWREEMAAERIAHRGTGHRRGTSS